MGAKRTYSTREKQRNSYQNDTSPDSRGSRGSSSKRQKHDDSDELSWLTPTSSRTSKTASILKRASGKFGGPVSIPEEDVDVEKLPHANGKPTGLFEKALNGRLHPPKPKQACIHGSRDEFIATMEGIIKSKENTTRPSASYLPTPPAETRKPIGNGTVSRPTSSDGSAVKSASKTVMANGSTETPRLLQKAAKNEKIEQPYVPRDYESAKNTAPRRDILGEHLSRKTKEARLWHKNQCNSPFLRLPAHVRNRIYEYVLGGNTINIGYKTYQIKRTNQKDSPTITPIFKYHCTVSNGKIIPYKQTHQPWVIVKTSFTLLNGVSRQLYQETSILPYKLNHLAFDSHLTMWNFLFVERRLSRKQRRAITELMLPDAQPQVNMLTLLPNLAKFYLARTVTMEDHTQYANGWYKVVRLEGREPKLVHTRNIW